MVSKEFMEAEKKKVLLQLDSVLNRLAKMALTKPIMGIYAEQDFLDGKNTIKRTIKAEDVKGIDSFYDSETKETYKTYEMEIGYKQIRYELTNPFFAEDDKHAMEIVFGLQQTLRQFMPDMASSYHSCGICYKEKTDYEIKQHEDNLKRYAARMVKVLHQATQSYVIRLAKTAEAITEEFKESQKL